MVMSRARSVVALSMAVLLAVLGSTLVGAGVAAAAPASSAPASPPTPASASAPSSATTEPLVSGMVLHDKLAPDAKPGAAAAAQPQARAQAAAAAVGPPQLSSAGANFGSNLPTPADGKGYKQITATETVVKDVDYSTSNYYYATQAGFNGQPNDVPVIEATVHGSGVGTVAAPGLSSTNAADLLVVVLSTTAGGSPRPCSAALAPTAQGPWGYQTTYQTCLDANNIRWVQVKAAADGSVSVFEAQASQTAPLSGLVVSATGAPSGATLYVQAQAIGNANYYVEDPSVGTFGPILGTTAVVSGTGANPQLTMNNLSTNPYWVGNSLIVGGGIYAPAATGTPNPSTLPPLDGTASDSAALRWGQHAFNLAQAGGSNQGTLTFGLTTTPNHPTDTWTMAGVEIKGVAPGWYMGLQKNQIVFSGFGGMLHGADSHCTPSADWTPGVHCFYPFSPQVGHAYGLIVTVTASTVDTFKLTMTDNGVAAAPTMSWTAPLSYGLISPGFGQFAEYPISVLDSCTNQRFGSAKFGATSGLDSTGHAASATFNARWTYPNADCRAYATGVYSDTAAVVDVGYTTGVAAAGAASATNKTPSLQSPNLSGSFNGNDGLLVALVSAQASDPVTGLSSTWTIPGTSTVGPALTWTRKVRNTTFGGDTEVWTAPAPAYTGGNTGVCVAPCESFDNLKVTVTKAGSALYDYVRVEAFRAAGVSATATAGNTTGAPSMSLTPNFSGSVVTAIGYDYSANTTHVAGTGQTMDEQVSDPTDLEQLWAQTVNAPTTALGAVTVNDTAPTGDYWNLSAVEISTLPVPTADGGGASQTTTGNPTASPTLSHGDDLLVAYVSTFNGKSVTGVSAVTNVGLTDQGTATLTQVAHLKDSFTGDGGDVSVYAVRLPVNVINVTVTATVSGATGWAATMWAQPYTGTGAIGASATNAALGTSGTPTVSITPTRTGSVIQAVGYDADNSTTHVAGTGQTIPDQHSDTTNLAQMWRQRKTATATKGSVVTLNDTSPTNEEFDFAAVELLPY
jgi:hypothetical protein